MSEMYDAMVAGRITALFAETSDIMTFLIRIGRPHELAVMDSPRFTTQVNAATAKKIYDHFHPED